jgi:hypothetical protein
VSATVLTAVLIAAVLVFVGVLKAFRAAETATAALRTARGAAVALGDRGLSEDAKEAAARAAAGRLFRSFLAIGGTALLALAASALLVWGGSALGLYPLGQAVALATGWPFLFASALTGTAAWIALERLA